MTTRLWLVRHGQTEWNLEGRIQGHTQTDLNADGRAQARQLAEYFSGKKFAAVYSSDLRRAVQTAEPIAGVLGLPIQTSVLLRERDLGPYVGMLEPEVITRRKQDGAAAGTGDLADWTGVPNVETDGQMWSRCEQIFRQISADHAGEDVLVVTHGGLLSRTLYKTLGIPDAMPRRFSLANGIVAVIQYRDAAGFLLSLVDIALVTGGGITVDTASSPQTQGGDR